MNLYGSMTRGTLTRPQWTMIKLCSTILANNRPMLTNLFTLDGTPAVHLSGQPMPAMSPGDEVTNIEFRHGLWFQPRQAVKGVTFKNVGFSKNTILQITFTNCRFEDCLFIGTRFKEVEFHNCSFKDCTIWKAKFRQCYLDPTKIKLSNRYRVDASNAGVTLFHALLSNYAAERQDQFFAKADFLFRKWKRYQLAYDIRHKHIGKWRGGWLWFASFTSQWVTGFGYKPLRFFAITVLLFFGFSLLNFWLIGDSLQLQSAVPPQPSVGPTFVDTVFYTFCVLTVLGFSVVTPITAAAKLLTVFEALASIGWLGIFTALMVKRFLR